MAPAWVGHTAHTAVAEWVGHRWPRARDNPIELVACISVARAAIGA